MPAPLPARLKYRWGLYGLLSAALITLLGQILQTVQTPRQNLQWSLQAAVLLIVQLGALWRALPRNHRPAEAQHILPRFGPGNSLSLTRGTLIALLGGFLLLPELPGRWAWFPFGLYLLADLSDFLDGYAARVSNMVTRLGETLDMNNDSLGVLIVTLLAFQYGRVPWWYLPFGFARFIFLLALHRHQQRGHPVYPLRPSHLRRWFAGIQMGFIAVMLVPLVGPPATHYAATLFLIPFVGMFLRDYWQMTGQTPAFIGRISQRGSILREALLDWAPPLLRGLTLLIYGSHARGLGGLLPLGGNPISERAAGPLHLALGVLLALGLLGRVTPIAALILTGLRLQSANLLPGDYALIFALVYLLFVGSGKFAWWSPEDWLIYNRVGRAQ